MAKGIYIIGTDTEVGKTVIAAGLLALLIHRGYRAAYFKPVSSGQTEDENGPHPADAFFIRQYSGFTEDERLISPFAYREAIAPHLAARLEGKPVSLKRIKENLYLLLKRYEVIIAEAAGGLAVPLNDEGLMQYDLIRELKFACMLVTRAGLGTINHTLLTLSFARKKHLPVTAIFINRFTGSPLELENLEIIRNMGGVEKVYTIPPLKKPSKKRLLQLFAHTLPPEEVDEILKPLPDAGR